MALQKFNIIVSLPMEISEEDKKEAIQDFRKIIEESGFASLLDNPKKFEIIESVNTEVIIELSDEGNYSNRLYDSLLTLKKELTKVFRNNITIWHRDLENVRVI